MSKMKFGALLMPSHPPEQAIRDGQSGKRVPRKLPFCRWGPHPNQARPIRPENSPKRPYGPPPLTPEPEPADHKPCEKGNRQGQQNGTHSSLARMVNSYRWVDAVNCLKQSEIKKQVRPSHPGNYIFTMEEHRVRYALPKLLSILCHNE